MDELKIIVHEIFLLIKICTCEITNIHEHVCRLTRSKLKKLGGMKREGLVTWM